MPNFASLRSALAQRLRNARLRTALFALLLLSAIIFSIESAPKLLQHSSVVFSQDISLITSMPLQRDRIDYLLIAQPTSESPHYIVKFKHQSKLLSVKVPNSTHVNLEREVLLRNGIPYAIASPDWLALHPNVLQDQDVEQSLGDVGAGFLTRNAIGILLLALMILVMKKSLTGLGATATVIHPEKIKGNMSDLVGMEDIKREVAHLESMIENRELYKSHNIDKPFNVMLTGPAGTGKTRLAGYLAKKLNIPLIQASGSGLESGLVGGGSKTLNAIYKKAVAQGRCLIFLDEAQSLFMPRGRGERKWDDDTANTLLGLLDGIKSDANSGVIWVVASNFDDANSEMDEAMLRRFAVKINFRLPSKSERKELLGVFLRRKDSTVIAWDQLNLDYVAEITANLSPALLETVVDRASMIAIEEKVRIDTQLLFRAFERSAIGLTDRAASAEKDRQRERVALHELGHFFMQIDPLLKQGLPLDEVKQKSRLLKISTESVSKLGPLGNELTAASDAELQTLEELEQEVMQLYGGVAAEELFYGARGISVGSQNDIQKVTARLDLMVNQLSMYSRSKLDYRQLKRNDAHEESLRSVEEKADQLYSHTLTSIASYRGWMESLKTALMERYVLSKDEVFDLIRELQISHPHHDLSLQKVAHVQ